MNIGGTEFLIIAALALLLFGPSLLAFWLGYVMGQRKTAEEPPSGLAKTGDAARPQPEEPTDTEDATPAAGATPEDDADSRKD